MLRGVLRGAVGIPRLEPVAAPTHRAEVFVPAVPPVAALWGFARGAVPTLVLGAVVLWARWPRAGRAPGRRSSMSLVVFTVWVSLMLLTCVI